MFKKYISILLLILISSCNKTNNSEKETIYPPLSDSFPESRVSKKQYDDCNILFSKSMKNSSFNGSILVAIDGMAVYNYSNGYANVQTKEKITDSTLFHVASITKMFTSTAILLLEQEGKLSLNDQVKKHIPSFPYQDITITHLLQHTSSLPKYEYDAERLWTQKRKYDNNDVLKLLIEQNKPLNNKPGECFTYSNTGYAILALIIEKVSGMKYSDFLTKRIFKPSEMYNTYVIDQLNKVDKKYISVGSRTSSLNSGLWGHQPQDDVVGDKGIYSTTKDLLSWYRANAINRFLNEKNKRQGFDFSSVEQRAKRSYGFGVRWKNIDGREFIYHNGKWNGYMSAFITRPDTKMLVIALSNTTHSSPTIALNLIDDYDESLGIIEPQKEKLQKSVKKSETKQKSNQKKKVKRKKYNLD